MCQAANNILCSCCELPGTTPLQAYDIGPIDLSICGRNLLSVSSSPRNHNTYTTNWKIVDNDVSSCLNIVYSLVSFLDPSTRGKYAIIVNDIIRYPICMSTLPNESGYVDPTTTI